MSKRKHSVTEATHIVKKFKHESLDFTEQFLIIEKDCMDLAQKGLGEYAYKHTRNTILDDFFVQNYIEFYYDEGYYHLTW